MKVIKEGHQYDLLTGNKLSFQDGTIPEVGINGTTNEEVLEVLLDRMGHLNTKFPCRENSIAITHLETALLWLNRRTENRIKRGVEGKHVA